MCIPNRMSLEVESLPALADSFPPLRQIDLEHGTGITDPIALYGDGYRLTP